MLVNVDTKTCSACKETKPLSHFYKSKAEKDGYKRQCRICHNKTNNRNPKPKLKYYHHHRKENPKYYLIKWSKARAIKKSIEHTITKDDIIFPEVCPYLGVPFVDRHPWYGYSIDRIDPNKGYTPDNIEIVSRLANMMKFNAPINHLIAFARTVLARHTEGG